MCLFLMEPWVGLLCVIVFFPDHIHFYLFGSGLVVHVMWYNFVLCKIVLILKKKLVSLFWMAVLLLSQLIRFVRACLFIVTSTT